MKRTTWWLRVVAAFYLALAAFNVYSIAAARNLISDFLPFRENGQAVSAFLDAHVAFTMVMLTVGIIAAYASIRPADSRLVVIMLIVGSVLWGVVDDLILLSGGFPTTYAVYVIIHALIIATGLWVLRTEHSANSSAVAAL